MNRVFFKKTLIFILLVFPLLSLAGKMTYTNVNNNQLKLLMKAKVTVVDIRRPEEWKQTGVIKGSKQITMFDKRGNIKPDFLAKFQKIAKPKDQVVLICRTGSRTAVAAEILSKQLGYDKIYNVLDGIYGWRDAKLPLVKPK